MKTVLLLTDFSENAANAAVSGITIAAKTGADILLMHNVVPLAVTTSYGDAPLISDESYLLEDNSESKLKAQSNVMNTVIINLPVIWRKPHVKYESTLGSLGSNVKQVACAYDIDLIVMGAGTHDKLDNFLFGSDTHDVIEHANKPVMIVPQNTRLKQIKKIVFATNFEEIDITALKYLDGLARSYNYELIVAHVSKPEDSEQTVAEGEEAFKKEAAKLKKLDIAYHAIGGIEVADRLNRFAHSVNADVLAMGHRQHSFFGRLFQKSTARAIIDHQRIPVLIFPSSML